MPYSPATSYNYGTVYPDQPGYQDNYGLQQGLDFSRWAVGQGIDLANLARADRNTQLAVQNAFQQQQADRAFQLQQQAQNAALQNQRFGQEQAIRGENWSRSLSNPMVFGAWQQASEPTSYQQRMLDEARKRREYQAALFNANYGGIPGGSYSRASYPLSYGIPTILSPAPKVTIKK